MDVHARSGRYRVLPASMTSRFEPRISTGKRENRPRKEVESQLIGGALLAADDRRRTTRRHSEWREISPEGGSRTEGCKRRSVGETGSGLRNSGFSDISREKDLEKSGVIGGDSSAGKLLDSDAVSGEGHLDGISPVEETDVELLRLSSEEVPEQGVVENPEETEEGKSFDELMKDDYHDIVNFDVDEMEDEELSEEDEILSLQDIYHKCQMIRRRRMFNDIYKVWEMRVEQEERRQAMQILEASGFCNSYSYADEVADGIDAGLRLVPERFWAQESSAKEISVDTLKSIVEEKEDAEKREEYEEYRAATEGAHTHRTAIVEGGPSTILYNYLKMNLLMNNVPMYYFPSYLYRFTRGMEEDDDEEDIQQSSWSDQDD